MEIRKDSLRNGEGDSLDCSQLVDGRVLQTVCRDERVEQRTLPLLPDAGNGIKL